MKTYYFIFLFPLLYILTDGVAYAQKHAVVFRKPDTRKQRILEEGKKIKYKTNTADTLYLKGVIHILSDSGMTVNQSMFIPWEEIKEIRWHAAGKDRVLAGASIIAIEALLTLKGFILDEGYFTVPLAIGWTAGLVPAGLATIWVMREVILWITPSTVSLSEYQSKKIITYRRKNGFRTGLKRYR